MKSVIKMGNRLTVIVVSAMFVVGLAVAPVYAVPIVFNLGSGGTVSYAGGANQFMTTDGAVTSVSNGGIPVSIIGGDLDFATGNYISGSATITGFENKYDGGGYVTISGNVGAGSVTLLTGEFANESTFSCCTGNSFVSVSSFSGLLSIYSIDAGLASVLGFNLPPTGGSIAQVEILLGSLPVAQGLAFTGTQTGGAVIVTDSVPVPEPTTLLLLGTGLAGLGILGRLRRNINNRKKKY